MAWWATQLGSLFLAAVWVRHPRNILATVGREEKSILARTAQASTEATLRSATVKTSPQQIIPALQRAIEHGIRLFQFLQSCGHFFRVALILGKQDAVTQHREQVFSTSFTIQ